MMPPNTDHQERAAVVTEKMAVLGRMLAGIVHEMNSPSSAISAASVNAVHHIQALLSTLLSRNTLALTEDEWVRVLELIQKMTAVLDKQSRRSPAEMRTERKRLTGMLEQRGIPKGAELARQLARMDLGDSLDDVLELAHACPLDDVLLVLTHCHRIVVSLQDIQMSANMLVHDVRSLKSYAHPGQKQPELLDVHETLDVALTILKNHLKQRVQVECQYADLPFIMGYAGELSHVWSNLLQNALHAMKNEGRILIETFAVDGGAGIRITDNGPGIPEDVQPHIFEDHFTTKAPGEGTGLGLALVRQIITKHQGTITVRSHPGQTVFEVRLPFSPSVSL